MACAVQGTIGHQLDFCTACQLRGSTLAQQPHQTFEFQANAVRMPTGQAGRSQNNVLSKIDQNSIISCLYQGLLHETILRRCRACDGRSRGASGDGEQRASDGGEAANRANLAANNGETKGWI